MTFYAGKAGAVVRIFGVDKSDVVLWYFLDEDSSLELPISLVIFCLPNQDNLILPWLKAVGAHGVRGTFGSNGNFLLRSES